MSRIQDRKKQRLEYLRKKRTAYANIAFGIFGVGFYVFLTYVFWWAYSHAHKVGLAFAAIMCLLCFSQFLGLIWKVTRVRQKAKQLPYVPPVTADTLTSEEVLLRGSDASAQEQSHVLLRGTQNTEETNGQELLRGSQGHE